MATSVTAILLSAGKSTRMGSTKALLDWHGIPMVKYQVQNLIDGGVSQVIVVLGHNHKEISKFICGSQARFLINKENDWITGQNFIVDGGLSSTK